jgi:hypothetical protein
MRFVGYFALAFSLVMVNATGSTYASLYAGMQDEKQPIAAKSVDAPSPPDAKSTEAPSPSTAATGTEGEKAKDVTGGEKEVLETDDPFAFPKDGRAAAQSTADEKAPPAPRPPAETGPGFDTDDAGETSEIKNQGFDRIISEADPMDNVDIPGELTRFDQLREKITTVTDAAIELRDILQEIRELQTSIDPGTTAAATVAATAAPPRQKTGTVFLICVADTNDNAIGRGAAANSAMIKGVVEKQCGSLGVRVVTSTVEASRFHYNELKSVCREIKRTITAADTVFMYVSAHGAYDRTNQQHYFQMNNGRGSNAVLRQEMWSLIKDLGARQTVLFADSCAIKSVFAVATADFGIDANLAFDSGDNSLGYLLTYQVGDFDINASTKAPSDNGSGDREAAGQGQFAVYPGDNGGGLFTRSFAAAAKAPGSRSWKTLMTHTQEAMDFYLKNKPLYCPDTPFGPIVIRKQNYELVY